MKYLFVVFVASFLSGCVSFGMECRKENINGWVKVKRLGMGVSKAQSESLAIFKDRVCL